MPQPANCLAHSQQVGPLGTSREHCWQRDADGELRSFIASLAAVANDCSNMSGQPSPPAWAWPGGQRRERRRLGQQLLLTASSGGGDEQDSFHALVVDIYILTVVFLRGEISAEKG